MKHGLLALMLLILMAAGCSLSPEPDDPDVDGICELSQAELEELLVEELDDWNADTDFTLMLETELGNSFSHSVGDSSPATTYRSASTSKWVTAVVLLDLVDRGIMTLDDHPQETIDFWPASGVLSQITLRHLLSFTSGLTEEALCLNFASADYGSCVETIMSNNLNADAPGSSFHYGSAHMQVAGLMAIRATGSTGWSDVFNAFRNRTGLFGSSSFDLPSASNPRLAGGMQWVATDYMAFLDRLASGNLLSASSMAALRTDHVGSLPIADSPALDGIGEDWHYGLGAWIECHNTSFNCTSTPVMSSAGAYGAYPFIDFELGVHGLVAREGTLFSFREGYRLFEHVRPIVRTWAGARCES